MNPSRYIQYARRTVLAAALGLAVALAPSAAWPQFGAAVPLTIAGETADQAKVAIDSSGEARITLRRTTYSSIFSRTNIFLHRKTKAGLSTLRRISRPDSDASNPDFAVNPAGVNIVGYQQIGACGTCIWGRRVSASGVPGPILFISDGTEPDVAFSAQGASIFVWRNVQQSPLLRAPGDTRIQARTVSAAGALGPVKNISPANGNAFVPKVAVDADGDALFVWRFDNGTISRIQARSLSAAGVLGPIQNISPAGGSDSDFPEVAMRPNGRAVIVWQHYDAATTNQLIETRARSPTGGLGPVVALSSPGAYSELPKVAFDAVGDALFIWAMRAFPNARIQARHLSAGGVLKPIQNISAVTGFATEAQMARNANGDAVIIWTRQEGATVRVQARRRDDAGPVGPIQTLSGAAPFDALFPSPRIAMNDDGDAVAVWGRFDGSNDRIWIAFGP